MDTPGVFSDLSACCTVMFNTFGQKYLTEISFRLYFIVPTFVIILFKLMLHQKLCQIGFTDNEASVYLGLFKLGPQAVSIIAKKNRLNRTTAYSVIRSLLKKGIVSSYVRNGVSYFTANDPNSLIGYLDMQSKTFDYYRSDILSSLPQIRGLCGKYFFKKPVVSYFDGVEGVKRVMYDALATKDLVRAYVPMQVWFDCGMKNFLLEYKKLRVDGNKVPLKAIVPDLKEVHAFFDENYNIDDGMTELLYVSASLYGDLFKSDLSVFDDKVSIVHLDKGDEYGVLIQSAEVSQMYRTIFDITWNFFKK